ncbi:MAG: hypothetical protein U0N71_08745 [Collinsella sp.]
MIQLPKDADGREIPLDTKVLYDRHGDVYEVACYVYAVRQTISRRIWDAKMLDGTIRYTTSLYLTPPDSWEKLEEDLDRGADALNYEACAYFGKSACDCSSCIADKGETCERVVMRDIADRIRKLRGDGDA